MARDGRPTRNKILAESKELVFEKGFAGTSIDQILDRTGITKGAFFYHFKTKSALAKALIEEFAQDDMGHMEAALKKTEHLKGAPLERLSQFVQEFIDLMSDLSSPPSCLYASYTYEPDQFDKEVLDTVEEAILKWKETFKTLLKAVLQEYDLKMETNIDELANNFFVTFEGSFVISRALKDPSITAKQLQLLKNHFQLLFERKVS
ncbi:TetR/AcrR family transcriptional regulator [Flagellimonas marina]|jgi:TetR/AcrR family transcriptional repressor of nem operon|uniref:TetR/AcrR family transcriptional regulator n=1 Tax=Flagellimonas marina TaxID=1775168 RepID=A0ABV8PIA1_9FLAO